MPQTLYYCMSNRQLRQVVYAYGKSVKAKSKAAAILRLRQKRKQQEVDSSGFFLQYNNQRHQLLDLIITKFTIKQKKNLQFEKPSYVNKTYNFSNLKIQTAESLNLQGRSQLLSTYKIRSVKPINYKLGKRRTITRPRKRIEVSEEVPSQPERLSAASSDFCSKIEPLETSSRNAALASGQHSVPRDGLKPICALIKIIASIFSGLIGLTQMVWKTPIKYIILYILLLIILRIFKPKAIPHVVVCTILLSILYALVKGIIKFNNWCYNYLVKYRAYQEGQQFRGVRIVTQGQIQCIKNDLDFNIWED